MPNLGARLLPWVSNGKANARPRVKDLGSWNKVGRQPLQPFPRESRSLAASVQCPMPKDDDVVAERADCPTVGRHGVIGEVSSDDLRQPAPGFRDRPVQPLAQSLFDYPVGIYHR